MKNIKIVLLFFLGSIFLLKIASAASTIDLTVAAWTVHGADGLGQLSSNLINMLKNDLKVNFLNPSSDNLHGLHSLPTTNYTEIIKKNGGANAPGNVVFYIEMINKCNNKRILSLPGIKFACVMFETSSIPREWADDLNLFDGLIVPDAYIKEMLAASGVQIPIFVIPLISKIDIFLDEPVKNPTKKKPFVFTSLVHCQPRKNQHLLIQAFNEEFGNDDDVLLKLNSRDFIGGTDNYYTMLVHYISSLHVTNIQLTRKTLSWPEYIEMLKSTDCYVNIAKGEGYSISPREALALRIPCILSNNTAHKSICESGFVRAVPCPILEPATNNYFPDIFGSAQIGHFFNCTVQDVRAALRDVYDNYEIYLEEAHLGRAWLEELRWNKLKQKYISIFKPKKVILGDQNSVTENYVITNSPALYKKYMQLIKQNEQ